VAPRGTYLQIADDLRQLIRSGELPSGAMLPSELSLATERSIARGTARAALAVLLNEGLIEIVPGQGRSVVGETRRPEQRTAWQHVATALRDRLDAGEFGAGPLPSEAALVTRRVCDGSPTIRNHNKASGLRPRPRPSQRRGHDSSRHVRRVGAEAPPSPGRPEGCHTDGGTIAAALLRTPDRRRSPLLGWLRSCDHAAAFWRSALVATVLLANFDY
jgi:DNA-binding transcriptional regulator YhcF (GntR family)